jgi:restriction system protein
MARRGFFAELQRQSRIAQRERERQEREAARDHVARVRRLEQTQKAAERARIQSAKAQAADQKRLEKEAREAHIAAREAEVEERNQELSDLYADIDTLLESTLSRDDYVDLTTLRVQVKHPPFERTDLEEPVPAPSPDPDPPQPVLQLPEAPRGLASFFGKRKHAEAVDAAERAHEQAMAEWQAKCIQVEVRRQAAKEKYARDEQNRLEELGSERARYAEECRAREEDAAAKNRSLEELITNLGYGTVEAVQEYVSIVLSNSVYPDHFPVTHEFTFDPVTAELELRVEMPEPNQVPTVKAYKYSRASDEIVATSLSQKECRERYASAVHQIALRSFHKVFEADRRGLIRTVSLEVGTAAVDPGSGRRGYVPFVIAAAERDAFLGFDLSAVVPAMTLARLGAAVSRNPFVLAPAERAGVRRA